MIFTLLHQHVTAFKLDVNHLMNGIEQLYAVIKKTEVFLMALLGAVIVLMSHPLLVFEQLLLFCII